MDEEDIEEDNMSDEEFEEGKGRKVKLNTGKSTKASIKPAIYKKGKWNPSVESLKKCSNCNPNQWFQTLSVPPEIQTEKSSELP
jgi:hypothetical protein